MPVFQAKNHFFEAKYTQLKESLLFHSESALAETLTADDTKVKKTSKHIFKPPDGSASFRQIPLFLNPFFFLLRVGENQTVDTESIFVIIIYLFFAC